jgi:hypothetical protein
VSAVAAADQIGLPFECRARFSKNEVLTMPTALTATEDCNCFVVRSDAANSPSASCELALAKVVLERRYISRRATRQS